MAWTASIRLDEDKTDVGTVQCIWNAGQPDQFVHSKRIALRVAAGNALAAEAKAALAKRDAQAVRTSELIPIMEGYLNG